jgi:serine/threonine-protein kinase
MSQILARLKTALSGRYAIERELGSGGMATVYLARDERHDRPVAIKVLHPTLVAARHSRRFLTEVHVTANLQHPNILPLHDSGEAEGLVYYVMPFVDGESLRVRLARTGPLPLAEALPILEEVADALACAHERGIVHRDIKPENILLSRGHALVSDFGVAKAADIPDEISTVTGEGLAVGTPAYMAPEQAISQGKVNPRADLYALGLVAFETITGRHPFDATTPTGMIAAHISTPAPRLSTRVRDVPPALDDLVAKLLAKRPDDRPADAAKVRRELREIARGGGRRPRGRLAAILAGVLILAAALVWARGRDRAGLPASLEEGRRSLAVLPLTRIGGDSTDDYFGDGIADELISTLGRLPGLRVASRTSSFAFKGTSTDLREIGGRLGVQTVLEGSVQRSQDRVRVIARLVDVGTDAQLWTGTYDGTMRDVFAMQDSVVRAIARALQFSLSGTTVAGPASPGTTDPVAHDLYLRGRHFLGRRTPSSLGLAIQQFNDAIARDSTYAEAWAGLATAWAMSAPFAGGEPRVVFPRALEAADRALALDSTAANAHTARAVIAMFYEWDLKLARREFDRSLALNPSDGEAHLFYHWLESMEGNEVAARTRIETAARLDPLSVIVTMRVGTLAWFQGRYEDAEASLRKSLQFDSTFHMARAELGLVLLETGNRPAARAILPPPGEVLPGSVESAFPAIARVALGDTAGARRTRAVIEEMAATRYVATDLRAMVTLALGDVNGALDLLERAMEERAFTMIFIGIYPPWRVLRNEPRFQALLAKLGLPPMA